MSTENLTPTVQTDSGPSTAFLSKSRIKPGRWYRVRPRVEEATVLGAVAKTLIGLAIGGLAYAWGAHRLAILIWIVAAVIGLVTLSSQKARSGVGRFFAAFGRGLGWLLGTVLLAPVFLIGFTIARVVGRLAGRDPLHLRDTESQTYWLPADQDRRTVRHIRSLFATETRTPSGRMGVIAVASLLVLLVVAELVARSLGFGNAILYQPDAQAGFYPAPNQESHRYGGLIKLNSYGMRGPEYKRTKAPGTLRIFMIGDSTLWGGSYVDQSDIYARLLDDLLDSKPGANDVEVWNMGVNAWGPFQELGYVAKFGTFDSDIAVVCLPIADIYRGPKGIADTPWFTVDAPPRFGLQEILRHLMWRSREMMVGPASEEIKDDLRRAGIAKYVELAEKLRANGCHVMFAVLPSREAGMTGSAPEIERSDVDQLRAALAPLDVLFDFPVGLFQDKGSANEIYHDECHLLAAGHHVYADHLKSLLEKESPELPAHKESAGAAPAASGGGTR